jgi:hypothetical protein
MGRRVTCCPVPLTQMRLFHPTDKPTTALGGGRRCSNLKRFYGALCGELDILRIATSLTGDAAQRLLRFEGNTMEYNAAVEELREREYPMLRGEPIVT